MPETKRVLIVGGGVAALSAAAALVEHNRNQAARGGSGGVRFDVTVTTSDEIWGGRASSWPGGGWRHRYEKREDGRWALKETDFRHWPPEVPLNHGFHAVFDESTYVNFWHTLEVAGLSRETLKRTTLITNSHEILVHESAVAHVCRLQVHDPDRYPYPANTHLTEAAWQVLRRGGWSVLEILDFGLKVVRHVWSYRDFDDLARLDDFQQISFEKWCRDRGVRASVFNKMMFKFLFQGTYIAPNTMDAASALMGLWAILRHKDAARWYYINGGITALLMDPIVAFLQANGVTMKTRRELTRFITNDMFSRIVGFDESAVTTERAQPEPKQTSVGQFDYYICTLPLDSLVMLLENSGPPGGSPFTLLEGFPDVKTLKGDKRFPQTAGTVNLQAWFREPGLLADSLNDRGDYRNVISGLEPLCVLIDYKNVLPMYRDDPRFTGSVLEINGSLQELQSPEHYGYFECDVRFGQPQEAKTIEFARAIMIDIARRYGFPKLLRAVEENAFLEFQGEWDDRTHWRGGNTLPPFLWKNADPFNRFFVTGPGTLQHRPWIWRREYPPDYLDLRKTGYPGPGGYPDNLFLAGDWTRNGFDIPSMEGAARSGRMAALAVLKTVVGRDATADPRLIENTRGDPEFIQVPEPH